MIFILQSVRHIFVPAERKVPKVRIETRQADILSSQRIIAAIDSWPRNSRYPLVSRYRPPLTFICTLKMGCQEYIVFCFVTIT
jgi:exoribonuclease R